MLMPMPAKYSSVSTEMGAAPVNANLTWSSPRPYFAFAEIFSAMMNGHGLAPLPPSWQLY